MGMFSLLVTSFLTLFSTKSLFSVVVKADNKLLIVSFPDGRDGRYFTLKSESIEHIACDEHLMTHTDDCPTTISSETNVMNCLGYHSGGINLGAKGNGGLNLIYPCDLLPFMRRPLFLVIDSGNSNAFKDKLNKAEKVLSLSINLWAEILASSDMFHPVWAQVLGDPFLRRVLLRLLETSGTHILIFSTLITPKEGKMEEDRQEVKSFKELGIVEQLVEACHSLGWKHPSKIQADAINSSCT